MGPRDTTSKSSKLPSCVFCGRRSRDQVLARIHLKSTCFMHAKTDDWVEAYKALLVRTGPEATLLAKAQQSGVLQRHGWHKPLSGERATMRVAATAASKSAMTTRASSSNRTTSQWRWSAQPCAFCKWQAQTAEQLREHLCLAEATHLTSSIWRLQFLTTYEFTRDGQRAFLLASECIQKHGGTTRDKTQGVSTPPRRLCQTRTMHEGTVTDYSLMSDHEAGPVAVSPPPTRGNYASTQQFNDDEHVHGQSPAVGAEASSEMELDPMRDNVEDDTDQEHGGPYAGEQDEEWCAEQAGARDEPVESDSQAALLHELFPFEGDQETTHAACEEGIVAMRQKLDESESYLSLDHQDRPVDFATSIPQLELDD